MSQSILLTTLAACRASLSVTHIPRIPRLPRIPLNPRTFLPTSTSLRVPATISSPIRSSLPAHSPVFVATTRTQPRRLYSTAAAATTNHNNDVTFGSSIPLPPSRPEPSEPMKNPAGTNEKKPRTLEVLSSAEAPLEPGISAADAENQIKETEVPDSKKQQEGNTLTGQSTTEHVEPPLNHQSSDQENNTDFEEGEWEEISDSPADDGNENDEKDGGETNDSAETTPAPKKKTGATKMSLSAQVAAATAENHTAFIRFASYRRRHLLEEMVGELGGSESAHEKPSPREVDERLMEEWSKMGPEEGKAYELKEKPTRKPIKTKHFSEILNSTSAKNPTPHPDAPPKRPLTSFFRYVQERRPHIVEMLSYADGNKPGGKKPPSPQVVKMAADEWWALSEEERQVYTDAFHEDMKVYREHMQEYESSHKNN